MGFVSCCDQSLQLSHALLFTLGFFSLFPQPTPSIHLPFDFLSLSYCFEFFLFFRSLADISDFSSCRLSLYFQFFVPTGKKKLFCSFFFLQFKIAFFNFYFISFRIPFLSIFFSLFIYNEMRTHGESERDREWGRQTHTHTLIRADKHIIGNTCTYSTYVNRHEYTLTNVGRILSVFAYV